MGKKLGLIFGVAALGAVAMVSGPGALIAGAFAANATASAYTAATASMCLAGLIGAIGGGMIGNSMSNSPYQQFRRNF